MTDTAKPRLLLKTAPGREMPVQDGFSYRTIPFRCKSLFREDSRQGGFRPSGSRAQQWYVVEPREELDRETNPWDFVYQAASDQFGLAAADRPALVEPDLEQSWDYQNETPLLGAESVADEAGDGLCRFNDQDSSGGKAVGADFGWFLGDDFSQLRSAREKVGEGKRRVKVAHLDTGFDPGHVTLPRHLNLGRQRNFADEDRPDDASDPATRGFLLNPGHGTGTLGILAGSELKGVGEAGPLRDLPLGGAPQAEIVPLRVADSVLHFYSSSVAQAIEYLTLIGCEVMSMSMGGLPSSAWTEAVNKAYEAGVTMVCASGNNFGGLPTRFIVYPARYKRVTAACGVMADDTPYFDLERRTMQGNWGPRGKMMTAISAYTPNIPWAELGCAKIVDMDGMGTSSATPQVAAAAALWIMHHDPRYEHGWQKAEAVRKALFDTARDTGDLDRMGRGILKARNALNLLPAKPDQLRRTPEESAFFPIFRLLFGLDSVDRGGARMLELEAAQLAQQSANLEAVLIENEIDPDAPPPMLPPQVRLKMVEAMAAEADCSRGLRRHLQSSARALRPQIPGGPQR